MSQSDSILLPVEEAEAYQEQVYQDVFFRKMAAAGHRPANKEAAISMLNTALRLREAEQAFPQAKTANDPYIAADADLAAVLSAHGLGDRRAEKQADDQLVSLAAAYAQDPRVYRSVLTLDHAREEG